MAGTFAYTQVEHDATGKALNTGTYTCAGGNTGSAIDTGLSVVEHFTISGIQTAAPSITNGLVTITVGANTSGTWQAYGY